MSDQGIWDQSYPPSLWAPPDPITPTGAVAGTPGSWQPTGASAPETLAQANALGLTLGAVWASGTWVDLAGGGDIHWNGTAFALGQAPALDPEPEAAARKVTRRKAADSDS